MAADPCERFREVLAKLVEENIRVAVSDGSIASLAAAGAGAEASAAQPRKILPDASILAAELIRLALVEATMRAKKRAETTGGAAPVITVEDVTAILPQFLLDFC